MSEKTRPEEQLRPEYTLSPEELRSGVRGKYAQGYAESANTVRLDPDVAEVFPDSDAVNQALRALARIIRDSQDRSA